MDTSKEEIVNLRKQINRLKISLMFTQVLMIAYKNRKEMGKSQVIIYLKGGGDRR